MVKVHRDRRRLATLLLLPGLALVCGCVERRYTVRSDPPGAMVIVNGEAIGPAPASHSFYYYGDREITLVRDGYQTKTVIQPINAPWWDNYLTEFFTENLVPFNIRDERDFTYQLGPAQSPTEEAVISRAEALRTDARILPPPRRGGILGWLGF
jgi:hypothetical protein